MIFVIQDRDEDNRKYIATFTVRSSAEKTVREFEEQDKEEGTYKPDRYVINKRGICYNDYSKKCGNCTNCICMLEHPDLDCPLVKKRAAMKAAADPANHVE